MTGPGPIYLDNAATTRPLPQVAARMAAAQLELFGNPSSTHAFGPPAKKALEDAREFERDGEERDVALGGLPADARLDAASSASRSATRKLTMNAAALGAM